MAHSLTTIGVHLECAIQAEMVVELELALIKRKQSRRFRHKSIIMQATKGFESVIMLMSQVATFVPGQRCQVTES